MSWKPSILVKTFEKIYVCIFAMFQKCLLVLYVFIHIKFMFLQILQKNFSRISSVFELSTVLSIAVSIDVIFNLEKDFSKKVLINLIIFLINK